jgi:hypothetical protein
MWGIVALILVIIGLAAAALFLLRLIGFLVIHGQSPGKAFVTFYPISFFDLVLTWVAAIVCVVSYAVTIVTFGFIFPTWPYRYTQWLSGWKQREQKRVNYRKRQGY